MDLLSLKAAGELMDRKSPNVVQGQSSGTGSGGLPPEVEAFRTFAHNTLHCIFAIGLRRIFSQVKGGIFQWPHGKYFSVPSKIFLSLVPPSLLYPQAGVRGLPGKIEILHCFKWALSYSSNQSINQSIMSLIKGWQTATKQ